MKYYKCIEFIEEQIGERELMLKDEESGDVHLLNATVSVFYRLCDGDSLENIVQRYIHAYRDSEVDLQKLRDDAYKICAMLKEKNIIRGGN